MVFRTVLFLLMAIFIANSFEQVYASNLSDDVNAFSRQSVQLFKQGQTQQALELELKAIAENRKDWQSHALLSYYAWQEGNVVAAISEGEEAVKFSPGNELVLLNLAQMEESVDACKKAIPMYEQCIRLNPNNWFPRLGLARCLIKLGKLYDGLSIIDDMASRPTGSFDWFSEVSDAYLWQKKADSAADAAAKALTFATTPEQKSIGSTRLLSALLRAGQLDRARALQDTVFQDCHPKNYELFVRSAYSLLPVTDPSAAKTLMTSALKNLTKGEDADGFYRLGRLFEDKSSYVQYDAAKNGAWLEAAETAYHKAISLDKFQARYYLALAGIMARQGKATEILEHVKQAQSLDPYDTVAAFLLSPSTLNRAVTDESALSQVSAITQAKFGGFTLTKVSFQVSGINCSCHLSMIENAFRKIDGIAFVNISRQEPYIGTMLIEQSVTPVQSAFTKCTEALLTGAQLKDAVSLAFKVKSSSPTAGVEEAIRVAQNSQFGDVLQFYEEFKTLQPTLPWTATAKGTISAKSPPMIIER